MIEKRAAIICGLALAFAAAAYAQTGTDPLAQWAALAKLQIPGFALEITDAEWHAAGKALTQPGQMGMQSMELSV